MTELLHTGEAAVIRAWHARGERLDVPGTAGTRIWRSVPAEPAGSAGPGAPSGAAASSDPGGPTRPGVGEAPVVCLHGVPASAFLYRKVLPALAARGLEGIALDLPGLGFADRPHPGAFDYSWTGLAAWLERALVAAGVRDYHLVVHDVGGPIGFDLIRRSPGRCRSLTLLNTMVRVAEFTQPWLMRPARMPLLSPIWIRLMDSPMIWPLFRWKGSFGGPGYRELRAYGTLLRRGDGGRAFRRIMESFENNAEFQRRTLPALRDRSFPAQVVWGAFDTELRLDAEGEEAREVLGLARIHRVRGKHFPQEDAPGEIAERIRRLVAGAGGSGG
ncbi:MAG: alpha/beta fold hydrolase [Candidatus Longimicrobiales bacterium M2_2A_002]